jgi:hypothetical protein
MKLIFVVDDLPNIILAMSYCTLSEQVKKLHFERGCRWFQLFYFLTRIIPVKPLANKIQQAEFD